MHVVCLFYVSRTLQGNTAGRQHHSDCESPHYLSNRISSPITGPRCPEGSRKFRFTDYVKMAQDGGKVVSLTHRRQATESCYDSTVAAS